MRDSIYFYINGIKKTVKGDEAFLTLSSYLRYEKHLTGTKVVCAEGDCGACTVMVAMPSPNLLAGDLNKYYTINSCITKLFALDGASIVTVEGLAQEEQCSEVQCSMVRNFAGQCGFCTPGFVMSLTNMLEQKTNEIVVDLNSNPKKENFTEQEVKNNLTGNLCRCTGYVPILKAGLDLNIEKHILIQKRYPFKDIPELKNDEILISSEECELYAPLNLVDASNYLHRNSNVIIYSGGTDLGVQMNKGLLYPKKILSLQLIPELYKLEIKNSLISIGARITLTEFQKFIKDKIPSLYNYLNIFASPQIKNSATLVGNLANASPIADITPALMALDAEIEIFGKKGRVVKQLKDFYLGYKKIDLQKEEIITQVRFELPDANQNFQNYKVSQRRDLDISSVNASFNFCIQEQKIQKARIAYGGLSATTLRLVEIEKQLEGRDFRKHSIPQLINDYKVLLSASVQPLSDVRGSAEYRKLLAVNLFEKFIKQIDSIN